MTTLLYGFDPLCGWCYGFVPALRHLRAEMPDLAIRPVMGGLVTGSRIGRYADMADYIRNASARMTQVTGMALAPAFFERILGNDSAIASSLIPCSAILHVRQVAPDRAADFATALILGHFSAGEDLNDPKVLGRAARQVGLELDFPPADPRHVPQSLAAEFSAARALGINSYPTLIVLSGSKQTRLETSYDPETVLDLMRAAL
jgi:putative protein-disulfide isomerase